MHIKVLQDLQMLHYNKNNGDITWYYFFNPEYVLLVTRLGFFDITTWNIWDLIISDSKHTCNPLSLKKKKRQKAPKASLAVLLNFLFLTTSYRLNGLFQKV